MDAELTETAAHATGVAIDYDPAVWLPGPTGDAAPDEVRAWIEGALRACCEDFRVTPDTAEERHLREVLTEFGSRELACDFRFLRLRAVDDAPLVARLDVHVGEPSGGLDSVLEMFTPGATGYDTGARTDTVDPDRGLRRALMFTVDDGIRTVVRYHRRVEEWQGDVVLSCTGADLRATAAGLSDLDALARAVWLVSPDGSRR